MSGLFRSTTIKGTRITDFAKTSADVGNTIPFLYGRAPVTGNVIFAALPPKENRSVKKQGKGGVKQETFTYTTSYAISFCRGPIQGYWWIKRNGKVVYSQDPAAPIEDKAYAAKWAAKVMMYNGTSSQMPNSVIESYKGSGRVSAFRYLAYIVVPNDDVTDQGGAIPSYEAVPIASPSEVYLTSHPYAQVFADRSTIGFGPLGGEMKSLVLKGRMEEEKVTTGLGPSSGEIKEYIPPYIYEESELGIAAAGGKLDLPPWGQYKDKSTVSFGPDGGAIFNPPLGEYEDSVVTEFGPTGGELSGTPTPVEPSPTILLFNADGLPNNSDAITDESGHCTFVPYGGAKITTANPPPGSDASAYFETGAHRFFDSDTFPSLEDDDFTFEALIYIAEVSNSFSIVDTRYFGNNDGCLFAVASNGAVYIEWRPSAGTGYPGGTGSAAGLVPLNTWTWVAITKSGTEWRHYVNGIGSSPTTAYADFVFNTSRARIGATNDLNYAYQAKGQIAALRVTKRVIYTEDYTPPSLPLPLIPF